MPSAKSAKSRSLSKYHEKRNFKASPEPKGDAKTDAKKRSKAKELVLLRAEAPRLAPALRLPPRAPWRAAVVGGAEGAVAEPEGQAAGDARRDHPFDYGEFEGVIPSGYGAGIVMLWDKGTWKPSPGFEDIDTAMEKGELKFELKGVKLKGSWVLVRTGGGRWGKPSLDEKGQSRSWLLIKHRDDWAGDIDVIDVAPRA
jgi:bifunctional non-homologous end joining protein LigD